MNPKLKSILILLSAGLISGFLGTLIPAPYCYLLSIVIGAVVGTKYNKEILKPWGL